MATEEELKCYFCDYSSYKKNILSMDKDTIVLSDNYPITTGHTLIIPKYHEKNIFDLDSELYTKLFLKAREYSILLQDSDKTIKGFNIGVNQGSAAGQTVMHAHIHLIPRRNGDIKEPSGGVRWIFPDKANYLKLK
jgi:ATP adenylyltransferase